jgi:penicillin-binding protein 1A
MAEALKGVPVSDYTPPAGVINVGGEWYFEEYGPGRGVRGLGLRDPWPGAAGNAEAGGEANETSEPGEQPAMDNADRRSILDLFKN